MCSEPPTDAMLRDAEQLLRAWFHWFRTDPDAPAHLPGDLHVDTVAFLAARAVEDGRKFYGPQGL